MEKDWYDKYGKEFHCADCTFLDSCLKKDEPLYSRCCEQYLRDRIAELEEQVKNAIVPKFKIGQEVWFIDSRVNDFNEQKYIIQSFKIEAIRFDNFDFEYEDCWGDIIVQNDLFTTKEEAQERLKNYEKL